MKVAFVYPGFFRDPGDRWIGAGFGLLSACIKKEGHQSFLIDFRRLDGWKEYSAKLAEANPDVIAFTATTIYFPVVLKASEIAKRILPKVPTVLGGIHATLMPEEAAAHPFFDHIVLGEGEISFPKILSALGSGAPVERIIRGEQADLDALPFSDRDLFGVQELPFFQDLPLPFVTVISARGCPYHCTFCQPAERILFGNRIRKRSVDNVIAELRLLREKHGFRSFMVHDDCLSADKVWVREFCRKLKEGGFDQPWVCQVRADHVCAHPELISEMKDAGLRAVHVGFETGNQRMLDLMRKGLTVEQNYKAYRILKELGIQMQGMFILGLPTETKEEILDTIRMMKSMELTRPSFTFFTPYPGTDLYQFCKERDLLTIRDYSDFDRSKMSPKIKGIDYPWIVESMEQLATGRQRVKNKIKSFLLLILGKSLGTRLIESIKEFKNQGSHIWPLSQDV
ncbi:MAG: radical SAM protein [Elusimicrobiota bacterium]|jgi:radical SAM superfamily enzyme YgiQ (UPF0313 family)